MAYDFFGVDEQAAETAPKLPITSTFDDNYRISNDLSTYVESSDAPGEGLEYLYDRLGEVATKHNLSVPERPDEWEFFNWITDGASDVDKRHKDKYKGHETFFTNLATSDPKLFGEVVSELGYDPRSFDNLVAARNERAKKIREDANEIGSRASAGGVFGQLAGGFVGSFSDPINSAAAVITAPFALEGIGATILFEGAAGGISQAIAERNIVDFKTQSLGIPQEEAQSEASQNIAMSAIGGAALGGVFGAAGKVGRYFTGVPSPARVDPRVMQAEWEFRAALGALNHTIDNAGYDAAAEAIERLRPKLSDDQKGAGDLALRAADLRRTDPYADASDATLPLHAKNLDAARQSINVGELQPSLHHTAVGFDVSPEVRKMEFVEPEQTPAPQLKPVKMFGQEFTPGKLPTDLELTQAFTPWALQPDHIFKNTKEMRDDYLQRVQDSVRKNIPEDELEAYLVTIDDMMEGAVDKLAAIGITSLEQVVKKGSKNKKPIYHISWKIDTDPDFVDRPLNVEPASRPYSSNIRTHAEEFSPTEITSSFTAKPKYAPHEDIPAPGREELDITNLHIDANEIVPPEVQTNVARALVEDPDMVIIENGVPINAADEIGKSLGKIEELKSMLRCFIGGTS